MANYFQTGFTALQELAKMKEIKVIEVPDPSEGQQSIARMEESACSTGEDG